MPYHIKKVGSRFKVVDDLGREYSKKGLTKARARAQQKALYASAYHGNGFVSYSDDDGHHMLLEGGGIFSDIFAKAKRIASSTVGAVVGRVKEVSQGIREDYPPDVRATIAKYGDGVVENLLIRREPIETFINKALNFISLGKWDKARKDLNFDKLYHLSMIATLKMPDGSEARLVIEKNEVINITPNFSMRGRMDMITVPVPCCITLKEMLDKAQQAQGTRFFKYDAFNNNCQMFLMAILEANDLSTPEIKTFVLQDVDSLLQQVPKYVSPFAKTITNVAGLFNVALKGRGEGCCGECEIKGGCEYCGGCGGCEGGGKRPPIEMKQADYFAEHKKIIALLNDIAKKAKAEAEEQGREVKAQKIKLRGGAGAEGFQEALATTNLLAPPTDPYAQQVGENSWEVITKPTDEVFFDEAKYNEMISRGLTKEAYEAKQAKKKVPGKSYEDYRKSLEDISRARATRNITSENRATEQAKRQQNILDYYNEYIRLNPQLQNVLCYSSPEGNAVPGGFETAQYRCDANNKIRARKEYCNSGFFGKVNCALTDVADFFVDTIGSKLPGVGKYIAEGYKIFAPPTSKFSGGAITRDRAKVLMDKLEEIEDDNLDNKVKWDIVNEVLEELLKEMPDNMDLLASAETTRKRKGLPHRPKNVLMKVLENIYGEFYGSGSCKYKSIKEQLEDVGLTEEAYLAEVRKKAKATGYSPDEVQLATDGVHKIEVRGSKAGRICYGDHILWSHLEQEGLVPKGYSNKKRKSYLARAKKIKGTWRKNKFSPNNLAINLLW